MTAERSGRVGVAIIRATVGPQPWPLITVDRTVDILSQEHVVDVTTSVEEAITMLEAWLSGLTAGGPEGEEAVESGDGNVTVGWRRDRHRARERRST